MKPIKIKIPKDISFNDFRNFLLALDHYLYKNHSTSLKVKFKNKEKKESNKCFYLDEREKEYKNKMEGKE